MNLKCSSNRPSRRKKEKRERNRRQRKRRKQKENRGRKRKNSKRSADSSSSSSDDSDDSEESTDEDAFIPGTHANGKPDDDADANGTLVQEPGPPSTEKESEVDGTIAPGGNDANKGTQHSTYGASPAEPIEPEPADEPEHMHLHHHMQLKQHELALQTNFPYLRPGNHSLVLLQRGKDVQTMIRSTCDLSRWPVEKVLDLFNFENDPRKRLRARVGKPAPAKCPKGKLKPVFLMLEHRKHLIRRMVPKTLNAIERARTRKRVNRRTNRMLRAEEERFGPIEDMVTHPPVENEHYAFTLENGTMAVSILHDSGCTAHAIDTESPLYRLLCGFKANKGRYMCGGGGTVQILGSAYLKLKNYPGGRMKVKVTSGMGRDVFSATQANYDGLNFKLSRHANGSLNAIAYDDHGYSCDLYEDRRGGLLFLDIIVNGDSAALPSACEKMYLYKDVISHLPVSDKDLVWHNRLAHEGDDKILKLISDGATGIQGRWCASKMCSVQPRTTNRWWPSIKAKVESEKDPNQASGKHANRKTSAVH